MSQADQARYEFAAEPKPVKSKAKYRDQNERTDNEADPRIQMTASSREDLKGSKQSMRSKDKTIQSRASEKSKTDINVQENNFIEILDRPTDDERKLIPDFYIDRPPTPEYKPKERGKDIGTQVKDNELFDFILEVEPVLQVLVGRTLEQSRIELVEDFERAEEKRHRAEFEKKRNAELMVTQRKEALYLRKQAEKQRRKVQHEIQETEKVVTHQKYLSRVIAKEVLNGIKGVAIDNLEAQGFLANNFTFDLRENYTGYLFNEAKKSFRDKDHYLHQFENIAKDVSDSLVSIHAATVQQEMNRRKEEAEKRRLEQEKKDKERAKRREIRRKTKLYLAKTELKDKIEKAIVETGKVFDDPFSVDITDIYSTGKDSISTVGGIFGELWLTICTLREITGANIDVSTLLPPLVHFLNEKWKHDLVIYLENKHKYLVEDMNHKLGFELIDFNQNKAKYIREFITDIEEINFNSSLGFLYKGDHLNQALYKLLNSAIFYVYFTSVEYKLPEKKTEEKHSEIDPNNPEAQSDHNTSHNDDLINKYSGDDKIPEVTPLDQQSNIAKAKIKLEFVENWPATPDFNVMLRFRVPLDREVHEAPQEQPQVAASQTNLDAKKSIEVRPSSHQSQRSQEKPADGEGEKKEEEPEVFIEPYDGSSFLAEKEKYPEVKIPAEKQPVKVYNAANFKEKNVANINEKAQIEIRRHLIQLFKEHVPAFKDVDVLNAIQRTRETSHNYEKALLEQSIKNKENTPIFDIEVPY